MRIESIEIGDFKGIRAKLEWSDALVLFGPNDAGKTNLLEALDTIFRGESASVRIAAGEAEADPWFLRVVLDLENRELLGSPDRQALCTLIQYGHCWFVGTKQAYDDIWQGEAWPETPSRPELPLSSFWNEERWPAREDVYDPIAFGPLLEGAREEFLELAAEAARDWPQVAEDFERLLDVCLQSRWIEYEGWRSQDGPLFGDAIASWLAPTAAECAHEHVLAAKRLDAQRAGWETSKILMLDEFVQALVAQSGDHAPFFRFGPADWFRPFEVVRISTTQEGYADLNARIYSGISRRVLRLEDSADAQRQWLTEKRGTSRVSEAARQACSSVGDVATEIAPEFVRERYEIVVEPLAPSRWHENDNNRVRLAVRRRGGELFPVQLAGSGVATWAAYSVEEAIRRISLRNNEAHRAEARDRFIDYRGTSASPAGWPRDDEDYGTFNHLPRTLFLIDEPERHLHPTAQEQAARFLADLVAGGNSVILAAHALPFLALDAAEAEYLLVLRDANGLTGMRRITADTVGALAEQAEAAGVGVPQLIQLTRGVLIVEGAHDVKVISHFYGDDLARHRVRVLPLHGTKNAGLFVEAELLRSLQLPIIVLFDQTADPASSERRATAKLLEKWPPESPPPVVVLFAPRDIFLPLPDDLVGRVLRARYGVEFPGWEAVEQAFTTSSATSIKPFLLKHLRLQQVSADELLDEILEEAPRQPLAGSPLDRVMNEVMAQVGGAFTPAEQL